MRRSNFLKSLCAGGSVVLTSCIMPPVEQLGGGTGAIDVRGFYHTIAAGETLHKISARYRIPVQQLVYYNGISDVRDLAVGTKLFIPGEPPVGIQKVYPTIAPLRRWQYLVVHHSATSTGNAKKFDYLHKKKGWDGVGYHFIINNGSEGMRDGQVEATFRWHKQINGAHCKANQMNERGVGVCLVGNLSETDITSAQFRSLIHLIRQLQRQFGIPKSRVTGHGLVKGANTECPGSRFPWQSFKTNLY